MSAQQPKIYNCRACQQPIYFSGQKTPTGKNIPMGIVNNTFSGQPHNCPMRQQQATAPQVTPTPQFVGQQVGASVVPSAPAQVNSGPSVTQLILEEAKKQTVQQERLVALYAEMLAMLKALHPDINLQVSVAPTSETPVEPAPEELEQ